MFYGFCSCFMLSFKVTSLLLWSFWRSCPFQPLQWREWMSFSFQTPEEGTQAWFGADSRSAIISWRPEWLEEWSVLHKMSVGDPVLDEGDSEGGLVSWEETAKGVDYRRCAQLLSFPLRWLWHHHSDTKGPLEQGLKSSEFYILYVTSSSVVLPDFIVKP